MKHLRVGFDVSTVKLILVSVTVYQFDYDRWMLNSEILHI